jgi:hypothetical protein
MLMIAGLSVILLAMEPSIRRFGTLSKDVLGLFRARYKRDSRLNWELRQIKIQENQNLTKA